MAGKNGKNSVALDLSEDTERPLVKLPDGNLYSMCIPGDFSIVEQTRLQRVWKGIQRITEGEGDMTMEEETILVQGYDQLISMLIPDAPEEVRERMGNAQRNKLMEFFGNLARTSQDDQTPPGGLRQSPSSSASTEAVGKTG